uniref:Uncharacterized protein n=1 Tax=Populus trichocarpa TaxID=3694 RepID=A0A3N7F6K2_POPTR
MENMLIYALLCSNNFMPPMESHMLRNACVQAIKEQVLPCVHTGLEVIVDLVPMAAINLSTTVVQMRPMFFRKDFNTDHLKCHLQIYLKNMLMLEGGAIREFVGNSMLVEVVVIGWDEMLRDDLCKGIFTMELEDEDEVVDDDGQANNDGELPSTLILKSLGKSVTVDLLDTLMIQFLSILKPLQIRSLWVRMSARAYLASYLARGKFLSVSSLVNVLKRLVDWCL